MVKKVKVSKKDDSKLFAFLATFLSIVGFVIALIARRNDKYVMFYAKQSLVVFIAGLIAGFIGTVFLILPIMGGIINFALNVFMFVLWLISWIYALSGKMKEVPYIGSYGKDFKF